MANTINADNGVISGITGIRTTADNTGNLALQTNGNTVLTLNTANVATFAGNATFSSNVAVTGSLNAVNTFGFKNRIINGGMTIDQRNAGASVTPTNASYTLDRWKAYLSQSSKFTVQQNAGSVTPPAGFINYLGATSSSAYSVGASEYFLISQPIEGLNVADLAWGTADAKTVTLSFWVRSSLTGTFGGAFGNSAGNRSYPFSYSIPVANTWTQISVTVAGDTTGTWLTTNGLGIIIYWSLGSGSSVSGTANSWSSTFYSSATGATSVVGTNGATFYITGVQLEVGSQATSFDFRSYPTELGMCYRYYRRWTGSNAAYSALGTGVTGNAVLIYRWGFNLDVPVRAAPSVAFGGTCVGWNGVIGGAVTVNANYSSTNYIDADLNTSGLTATVGLAAKVLMYATTAYIELTGTEL